MAATIYVCDQLSKTCHVYITNEFNFITPAYRYTQWPPIPCVSITLYINWSAFLEVILPTLQSHNWNNAMAPIEGANGSWRPKITPTSTVAY